MKNVFLLMILICLSISGCGTAEDSKSADQGETTHGQKGTGETLPTLDELEEGEVSDVSKVLNQLEYNVTVNATASKAVFQMELRNPTDETIELSFSSGQQYEIVVRDAATKEEVYRFSEGRFFTEALIFEEIEPDKTLTWEFEWNYEGREGKIEPGEYMATVTLLPMEVDQKSIDANPFVEEIPFTRPAE
ncbi:BsuPI-related putative proteinase inhibitor [Salinibacillus xinjiangensis]|uniref:BsuPI-related putative proteinase inhibitor n=1 Tax=Salinibacillus xinjiangensis TaxID=1229268 RepID=UPI001890E3B5|nr:BsuPI-related putative proteinase inhibitor [Salinibacillus xinjiangensis]